MLVLMASQSALILSHPLSPCFPPNRTSLSFHTLSNLSLLRPKSKFFPSSSLTGPTLTATPLSPSKLFASKIYPLSFLKPSNTLSTAAAGLLFFAPISSNGSTPGSVGTPIAVIAAGLARRCIDIYGRVLASQSALILSHPLSPRFPSSRTTLSFHTLSSLSLHRPKSKFFQSSSLTRSTRTVTPLSPSKLVASKICPLSLLKPSNTLSTAAAGPLFFAPISINGSSPGTPIAVIAAGLASRCLEIYGRVLLIRILLSLYPNIQWDKQPMSAIRDLCDPFLSLLRGIIPPLFNSVDVSPILAFLLLGMLAQFAKSPGISL